ncbi:MAG: protein kinase [Pirellulaceae bacterium]|nr:protein kinase [Pirellulaceae bacterium]
MATIVCPYCQHRMHTRMLKPGTFKPKCTRCQTIFGVKVPDEIADDAVLEGLALKQFSPAPRSSNTHLPDDGATRIEAPPQPPRAEITDETRNDIAASSQTRHEPSEPARQAAVANPQKKPTASTTHTNQQAMPAQLGGYRIISELGRGGLGVVYLANQMALQRKVALKVIRSGLDQNAGAIARFVREAYAAAQLVHHNVVQIYDLGHDAEVNFFSMELVDGKNLAEVIQENGKLTPQVAAGYILQAARGLEFAHNAGMVHRDIKPANLMINRSGIIKVADLGLVKWDQYEESETPQAKPTAKAENADLTVAGTTLGTINYMSPEQASDSTAVDHRADIYSLGCTFYALLAGTPPFRGKSVAEVISKHMVDPPPRIEFKSENLPGDVNAIIGKMMAKNPESRYQNLGELIIDLERFLGLESGQGYQPSQDAVATLEESVREFNAAPSLALRKWGPLAFAGAIALLAIVALLISPVWILPLVGFAGATFVSGIVIPSWKNREHWFGLWRELLWARRWESLSKGLIVVLLLLAVAALFGVGLITLLTTVLGVALGFAWDAVVQRGIATQRAEALERGEKLLQQTRLSGVSENALQLFVAKYAGNQWEEYFEALFGYQAKRRAREELSRVGAGSRKQIWRPWVDRLVDYLEKRVAAERQRRDQKHLVRVERAALVHQGVKAEEAEAQASLLAAALVEDAAKSKPSPLATASQGTRPVDAAEAARLKREKFQRMMAEARSGKSKRRASLWETLDPICGPLLSAPMRLGLGLLLLVAFGFWVKENLDISQFSNVTSEEAKEAAGALLADGNEAAAQLANRFGITQLLGNPKPLSWPIVGTSLSGFGPLTAGLLLIFTGLLGGWRLSLFALPAAITILFASSLGVPDLSWLGGSTGLASLIGVGLVFVGMLFRET